MRLLFKILANRKVIKSVVVLAVITGIFILWSSYQSMSSALNVPEDGYLYHFERGSNASFMVRDLSARGIIENRFAFKLWGRLSGNNKKLQAGEYFISPGMSGFQLLNKMARGQVKLYNFTIIEGWNFKQVMQALRQSKTLRHTISENVSAKEVMQILGYQDQHPEGRFFPDTYHYPANTTDVQFLKRAYNSMENHLAEEWENRAKGLPLKTPYEALILASIIEKESADPSERPLIAGVFINRLIKNMRLQTDPTVIYGLGDRYKGDIRFRHLREDTPYNTYTRRGLTPTPIAMPGLESLKAALNPAATEYLYFVATGENGKHYFSSSNEEHQRAVTRYQRYKRKKK